MLNTLKNSKLQVFFFAIFFILFSFLSVQVTQGTKNLITEYHTQKNKDETFLSDLTPEVFKIFSFGAWPMMVDWLWMQGLIVDDSLEHVKEGVRAPLYYYADYATTLDPAFFEASFYGGLLTMVVRDDYQSSEKLLLKGENYRKIELPQMPKEFQENYWKAGWAIPQTLVYLYMFEDLNIAKTKEFAEEVSKIPGSPDYLKAISKRLSTEEGQYEIAMRVMGQVAERFKERPEIYEKFLVRRKNLETGYFLFELNKKFDQHASRNPREKRERLYPSFIQSQNLQGVDPEGGSLRLDPDGKIRSSTDRSKKGGLPF